MVDELRIVVSTVLCKAGAWRVHIGFTVMDAVKLPPSRNGSQIVLSLNLSQYQYILCHICYSAVGRYII